MKILLLGSQHGNELLGEKLYEYIKINHPDLMPYITYKLANPRARQANLRYIDSDMNRSYDSTDMRSYEAQRARQVLDYINSKQFDLVIDLHTTRCIQPISIMVKHLNARNHSFIRASHIKHIVLMQHSLVNHSLIGVCTQAISIEVHDRKVETTLTSLCDDLRRFMIVKPYSVDRQYYVIRNLIDKTELTKIQASRLVNFQKSEYGYYPILTGNNSYKKNTVYLGFKGEKVGYNESND